MHSFTTLYILQGGRIMMSKRFLELVLYDFTPLKLWYDKEIRHVKTTIIGLLTSLCEL